MGWLSKANASVQAGAWPAIDYQKTRLGGSEGRRPATSIVAAAAGRVRRSFRLTPSGRFATFGGKCPQGTRFPPSPPSCIPNSRCLPQSFDLEKASRACAGQAARFQRAACLADMCGGFGSLAEQGFPARFPGRAAGAGETCSVGKDRQRRAFSTGVHAGAWPAISISHSAVAVAANVSSSIIQ